MKNRAPLWIILGLSLLAAQLGKAQTQTILHSFLEPKVPNDGASPASGMILASDGNFYGLTEGGGTSGGPKYPTDGAGCAFKMTPAGKVTVLHSFLDGSVAHDGAGPVAKLVQGKDGNFYGMTYFGGSTADPGVYESGHGTIFKMTAAGAVTLLHSFGDGSVTNDGQSPRGGLVQGADGNFYGTTTDGGSSGEGTVFKVTPAGAVTILHSFGDGTVAKDGQFPYASLILAKDGAFYGTTEDGGANGDGTLFKITAAGKETVLHDFASDGKDVYFPATEVIQGSDGFLYGTCAQGGANYTYGGVYKMSTAGKETIVYSFNNDASDTGYSPHAALVQGTDGNFYGTTYQGALGNGGSIFKLTPAGALTVLHNFIDGTVENDGYYSEASLALGADGNFYGTTFVGGFAAPGIDDPGTIFKVTPAGVYRQLYSFHDPLVPFDGASPNGLTKGSDGNFYGATTNGGVGSTSDTLGFGTIYQVTPAGVVTILHYFADTLASDGQFPSATVVEGKDGSFYGTAYLGGTIGSGIIFKVTTAGVYTVLHNFGDGTVAHDGAYPQLPLVLATDGNFYGTAGSTAFKMTPAGKVTIIHTFTSDDPIPSSRLIQASDGNFYGTSSAGGSAGYGTVFRLTTGGAIKVIHSFGIGGTDGYTPHAGLVQGTDGNLYGTTESGGTYYRGIAFKMTTAGVETILHNFQTIPTDGAYPEAGLTQVQDGNFCGTTSGGGIASLGTLFEIAPDGSFTLLYSFDANPDIAQGVPGDDLVEDAAGTLYSTTANGGVISVGTVYKFAKAAQTLSFPTIPRHLPTDAPFKLSAKASAGLPVTFSIVSGPAKITAGTVKLTGAVGTVVVQARQVGNSTLGPVTVTRSFLVSLPPQTITFAAIPAHTFGDPAIALSAKASSGLAVSYAVSGPATLVGTKVKLTGAGTVSVTASQAGNASFAPAPSVTQTFTVKKAAQTIIFAALPNRSKSAAPFKLTATSSSKLSIAYAVFGAAKLSATTVTLTGTGAVRITADQPGNANYLPAVTVTQKFTVTP